MLSSTASSTSVAQDPIASRVEHLAQPMLTLSSTASDNWNNNRPDTSAFSDHQIEALICALIRWDQAPINLLLAGLTLPMDTDEDRAAARRMLPFLVEALIDTLKAEGDRSDTYVGSAQTPKGFDSRERRSMLKMIKGIALFCGYDPDKPGFAVTKFLSLLDGLPETPEDRPVLDPKTVKKYFGLAWQEKLD